MKRMMLTVLLLTGCGQALAPLAATAPSADDIANGYMYNKGQLLGAKDRASNDVSRETMDAKDSKVRDAEAAREYLYTRGIQEMRHGKQRKDGSDGEQGPAGATGDQGSVGSQGQAGETGSAGQDGSPGVDGIAGVDGASGSAGTDGQDGAQGERGKRGRTGSQGDQGEVGPSGSDGEPGQSCSLERVNKWCLGNSRKLRYDLQISCGETSEIIGSYTEDNSEECRRHHDDD